MIKRSNNQIKSKIKSSCLESIDTLTIHGIPHLFRTKFISIRIIWILLTIASTCLAIHFIVQTFNEYFDYNVTTEVRFKEEVEFDFPAVTFCNKNKFSTNYSLSHIENILDSYKISYKERHSNLNTLLEMKLFFRFYPAFVLFRDLDFTQRKMMTKSLEEMLIFGLYDFKILNHNDFEYVYNKKYGNCFTFNSNSSFKIKKAGIDPGLSLDFYMGLPNYNLEELGTEKGIYLSIHDPRKNFYDDLENLIELKSGAETLISLERSVFYKYPYPYSDCELTEDEIEKYSKSIYVKQILNANYSYSRSFCLDFCRHDLMISKNKSSCFTLDSSIRVPNITVCHNKSYTKKSVTELYYEYVGDYYKKSEILEECLTKCPSECKMIKYTSYVTMSDLTSYLEDFSRIRLMQRNITYRKENLKNDLVRLRIYFNSMSSMFYKESPTMSIFGLVSNLGGTLGLFLGNI